MKKNYLIASLLLLSSCANGNIKETNFSGNTIQEDNRIHVTQDENTHFFDEDKKIKGRVTITANAIDIHGEASGQWYFEASFSVDLYSGEELVSTNIVQANEDWMTSDYVGFDAHIELNDMKKEQLKLIFKNANPSGLEEHALEKEVILY